MVGQQHVQGTTSREGSLTVSLSEGVRADVAVFPIADFAQHLEIIGRHLIVPTHQRAADVTGMHLQECIKQAAVEGCPPA